MSSPQPIVNKVAQKALITLDLEDYYPKEEDLLVIDLKDYLFKGLILKEADFRQAVDTTDWATYKDRYVVLHCSTNAIIPMWAYMVLTAALSPYAKDIVSAAPQHACEVLLYRNLAALNPADYAGQRVVIKGCGNRAVPQAAYVQITRQLAPVARAIMYGEPCSTVPVYKKVVQ